MNANRNCTTARSTEVAQIREDALIAFVIKDLVETASIAMTLMNVSSTMGIAARMLFA